MNLSEMLSKCKELPAIIIPLSIGPTVSKKTLQVYTEKASFVINDLSALLRKIDNTILGASYVVMEHRTEYVRVHYKDGSYYDKNVTADSLGTLAIEIIERVI